MLPPFQKRPLFSSGSFAAVGLTCALILLLCAVSACSDQDQAPAQAVKRYKQNLVIGLIPEHNVFTQIERYEPMMDYISRKTGVGMTLEVLSRYGNIINNFNSLALDGAFFGSFAYAIAHERIAVETQVRPEDPEGVSTYYGMIFVRKDSGISYLEDMRGKRFAFVDKATTAGYLLPLKYFRDGGLNQYRDYFSETYFTGTHEDAILDVLNRRAEAGAAKNTVFYRLAESDPRVLKELKILVRSPEVPSNALAFRSNLDEDLRSMVVRAFLEMHRDPEGRRVLRDFGAARFIVTTNEDYKPVFDYARAAGLDLATYDWMNE